jgi:hypothetical protein
MAKSKYALALDKVQGQLQLFFHQHGFRKRGRSYNRDCSDGIVQVINFQMGQYPIGSDEIPGLRENLYGMFTVNLGVYLPVVAEIETGGKPKKFYLAYDCHIRQRLGSLSTPGKDVWWDLNAAPQTIMASLSEMLPVLGLPFLEKFTSYQNCLDYYQASESLPGVLPARSAMIIGIICHSLGKSADAEAHFSLAHKKAIESASHPGFVQHIHEIWERCIPASASE